jgi:hypothetical protein
MKNILSVLFGLSLAALPLSLARADEEAGEGHHHHDSGGKSVTVEGELVDLACYIDHGARGEKHQACATTCAQNGLPIGLLDKRNNLYLVLDKDHKTMNATLADKMATTVKITGKISKRNGMSLIEAEKVD